MIDAWQTNMNAIFSPGFMNCLDESMNIWTNNFTRPGSCLSQEIHGRMGMSIIQFVVVPVALCGGLNWLNEKIGLLTSVNNSMEIWGQLLDCCCTYLCQYFTWVLLLSLTVAFCVLKGIIKLRKKGAFASALIKKQ